VHLVIAIDAFDPVLVTLWCPEDEDNVKHWKPGALGPTRLGVQINRQGTKWVLPPE